MITGTGIDIVRIDRVEKAIRNDRFLERVFTEGERAYLSSKKNSAQTAAGLFCAKEAVMKALKIGITQIPFTNIEIGIEEGGAPYVTVTGYLDIKFHISISHDGEYAVAQAIAERED